MIVRWFENDITKLPNGVWSYFKYDYVLGGYKKSKLISKLRTKNVFILKNEKTFEELEQYRVGDLYDWLKFSWKYRAIVFNYKLDQFGLTCTSLCTFEYLRDAAISK